MAEIKFSVDENALQVLSSTEIKANFAETKKALEELVKPYTGVIVDASNLRESKTDIARIRKVEKSIDSYRLMVKRYASAPIAVFEEKCKELKAVCTEAVSAMDEQVKAIERKQKDEKIESLRQFFDRAEKRYPDYVSFDEIFDPAWENKTCPIEKIQNDILAYIGAVERDIDIIKSLNSENEAALLIRYSENAELGEVMAYDQLLKRKKEEAAAKARQAEEAIKKVEEEKKNQPEPDMAELPFGMPEEAVIPTKTVQFVFRFKGTPSEIVHVENRLIEAGIRTYRMDYID